VEWDDPELWRWLWLLAAVVFTLGELAIYVNFFLASFAVGALVACVLAFFGVALPVQWVVFVVLSVLALAVLRPYSRRLDRATAGAYTEGANRWVGKVATVVSDIPAGPADTGLVRLEREQWRAESVGDRAIPAGTIVRVVRVDGTRMLVEPLEEAAPDQSPSA
jgi:membrane protein implicated in regulation of membrane protease activity